jgi:hypothetical protein
MTLARRYNQILTGYARRACLARRSIHTTPHTAIDLEQYPIHQKCARELIAKTSFEKLHRTGVVTLPGFINAEAMSQAAKESQKLAPLAHHCNSTHNAYLAPDDPSFPLNHIRRLPLSTDVGSVAYDLLPRDGVLPSLYKCDALVDFVSDVCFGAGNSENKLYRLADPLGACTINVFHEGWEHGWHFDEAEYTITLMLQTAEEGGDFEFTPQIRQPGSNEAFETVQDIVAGHDSSGLVQRLRFEPGTLSIFKGNSSLHRVTKTQGGRKLDRWCLIVAICLG